MDNIENTDDVKKKRVLQNVEDIADLVRTLADRLGEMTQDLGVSPADVLSLVEDHVPADNVRGTPLLVIGLLDAAVRRAYMPHAGGPMANRIAKLFASAPKMTDAKGKAAADQAPAVSCDVVLKCGQAMAGGALSVTPEGLYRYGAVQQMEVPSSVSPGGKRVAAVLVEMAFELEQIAGIATKTEIQGAGSRLVSQ